MPAVILGYGAYERLYAAEPLIRLENRFLEVNPTNLKEQTALLTRPGTANLKFFGYGKFRRAFSEPGMFNGDLFVIEGENLWRWDGENDPIQIVGVIQGEGACSIGWEKGPGYEFVFIADGLLFQYYSGGTHATGTLTRSGVVTDERVQIGATYYVWDDAVDAGAPAGTAANPWRIRADGDPLLALMNTLFFNGTPGFNFSSAIAGPNLLVESRVVGGPPALQLVVDARSEGSDGNAIVTAVTGTLPVLSWTAGTLTGGGINTLQGVAMPDGRPALTCCGIKGHMLVSVADTQEFYWLEPGEVVIDPLNRAAKESFADNIQDMLRVGDNVLIIGEASTESWYATGDATAAFAPVQGRVYNRGMIAGTGIVIKDSVIFVGDDGVVYQIGYTTGGSAEYGVNRISNHGIEERVRRQLRREKGLTP